MKYIYVVIACVAFVAFAYLAGRANGVQRCRADCIGDVARMQSQLIKQEEKINAETLNTGVADIRRVLRAKYTIAE